MTRARSTSVSRWKGASGPRTWCRTCWSSPTSIPQGKAFKETGLEGVMDMVMNNLAVQIKEKWATVVHDRMPSVTADDGQMVQLLQNLVSNAIKFKSQEDPQVHIGC